MVKMVNGASAQDGIFLLASSLGFFLLINADMRRSLISWAKWKKQQELQKNVVDCRAFIWSNYELNELFSIGGSC